MASRSTELPSPVFMVHGGEGLKNGRLVKMSAADVAAMYDLPEGSWMPFKAGDGRGYQHLTPNVMREDYSLTPSEKERLSFWRSEVSKLKEGLAR